MSLFGNTLVAQRKHQLHWVFHDLGTKHWKVPAAEHRSEASMLLALELISSQKCWCVLNPDRHCPHGYTSKLKPLSLREGDAVGKS